METALLGAVMIAVLAYTARMWWKQSLLRAWLRDERERKRELEVAAQVRAAARTLLGSKDTGEVIRGIFQGVPTVLEFQVGLGGVQIAKLQLEMPPLPVHWVIGTDLRTVAVPAEVLEPVIHPATLDLLEHGLVELSVKSAALVLRIRARNDPARVDVVMLAAFRLRQVVIEAFAAADTRLAPSVSEPPYREQPTDRARVDTYRRWQVEVDALGP